MMTADHIVFVVDREALSKFATSPYNAWISIRCVRGIAGLG
jgi:hypothetical protein